MKKRLILNLCGLAAAAILTAACAKVPFLELKAAQTAREEARDMALIYAPESYNAALALYDQARSEIELQSAKSAFGKSYSKAVDLLTRAKEGFESALREAMDKRAQLKIDAEEKSELAAAAILEAREAFNRLRRTSRNRADRQRWNSQLDGLSATLEDANDYLTSELYGEAIGYFDTILAECETIKTEITGT